jgi:hypothetical protein
MCIARAASVMLVVSDGYTENARASWSTVRRCSTASATASTSSEACGATTTPPITVPEPVRANSFTKPSLMPIIFARGLDASGSL